MKKRVLAIALSCLMVTGAGAVFAGCGGEPSEGTVNLTFWNPITGPDSAYMQTLVKNFNNEYKNQIYVTASAQAEDSHYSKITNSFNDKSTADICLIHKSRLPLYVANDMLYDMTDIIAENGLKEEDYVGDSWSSCEFNGKMYAMTYDVLPTVLYYNRNLIPEGYTEADILSDDFTVEKMIEMSIAAFDDSNPLQITYGIAFNFSYTESMFLSFLSQYGINAVSEDDPYKALFNCEEGIEVAEAIMSMPLTKVDSKDPKKAGQQVSICSASGTDHLNAFCQGRALFTLDGIWSAPDACRETSKLDAGVALLPKANDTVSQRTVSSDGHVFAMFNTANGGGLDEAKQEAAGVFIKYLIDNSAYWCQGGKIAARADVTSDSTYTSLEWGYLSTKLDNIISPVKVKTYNNIVSKIGNYVSDLCEVRATDVAQALASAASEGESLAKELG